MQGFGMYPQVLNIYTKIWDKKGVRQWWLSWQNSLGVYLRRLEAYAKE